MATIIIKKEKNGCKNIPFSGEEYTVDTGRKFGGYEPGDLICHVWPFSGIPLELEIAIRADGDLIFRSWEWKINGNPAFVNTYLHTDEFPPGACNKDRPWQEPFISTQAQRDTVSGMLSGRITFEGLWLCPGRTLQMVCPADLAAEEKRCEEKIFLA